MIKVAIVQNKLGMDGRSRVVAEIITLLNRRGIRPDVFVLTGRFLPELVKKAFEKPDIDFQLHTLLQINTLKTATILQEALLNWSLRRRMTRYDLVINSNDSLAWWPVGPHYIHYIHIPPKATMEASKPVHGRAVWSLYHFLLRLLEEKAPVQLENAVLLANSNYTAGLIEQFCKVPKEQIKVIYPPAAKGGIENSGKVREGIVSCGAFSPRKRQLDQLHIAEALPTIKLTLLGTATSKSYLKQCRNYAIQKGLHRVTFIPDAPAEIVKKTLATSRFFLHTRHYEEFGMAVVEAIEYGCIPIVHDSGGPREIVPLPELRYQTIEDALEKIRTLQTGSSDIMFELQSHIRQFTVTKFQEEMEVILKKSLGG